jgi:hypothetical protein
MKASESELLKPLLIWLHEPGREVPGDVVDRVVSMNPAKALPAADSASGFQTPHIGLAACRSCTIRARRLIPRPG